MPRAEAKEDDTKRHARADTHRTRANRDNDTTHTPEDVGEGVDTRIHNGYAQNTHKYANGYPQVLARTHKYAQIRTIRTIRTNTQNTHKYAHRTHGYANRYAQVRTSTHKCTDIQVAVLAYRRLHPRHNSSFLGRPASSFSSRQSCVWYVFVGTLLLATIAYQS